MNLYEFQSYTKKFVVDYRDILHLSLCWAWSLTMSTLITYVGPLSAVSIGAPLDEAPFTIGAFLYGSAFASLPVSILFRTYGRKFGFGFGIACQFASSLLGCLGLLFRADFLVYLSCALMGIAQGCCQYYRFAAIEIAPPGTQNWSVSMVLTGGVIAAVLGSNLGLVSIDFFPAYPYMGCYFMVGVIAILHAVNWSQVRYADIVGIDKLEGDLVDRLEGHWTLISSKNFVIPASICSFSQAIMVMVMSNVVLEMKQLGYSLIDDSSVLLLHFLSMFAPSFITGYLITLHGPFVVAMIGTAFYAVSLIILGTGETLENFFIGLILCGVAWNLCFAATTVMLIRKVPPEKARIAQSFNDFFLFAVSGSGTLGSGYLIFYFGWNSMIYLSAALVIVLLGLFFLSHCTQRIGKNPEDAGRIVPKTVSEPMLVSIPMPMPTSTPMPMTTYGTTAVLSERTSALLVEMPGVAHNSLKIPETVNPLSENASSEQNGMEL